MILISAEEKVCSTSLFKSNSTKNCGDMSNVRMMTVKRSGRVDIAFDNCYANLHCTNCYGTVYCNNCHRIVVTGKSVVEIFALIVEEIDCIKGCNLIVNA